MKKQYLLHGLLAPLYLQIRFWRMQAANQKAMTHVYVRKWRDFDPEINFSEHILINPHGSIFKVTHRHFMNNELLREESYLAIYGWHSGGHLIALGKERYLIFDTAQKLLYMEDWVETGVDTIKTFESINSPTPWIEI